MRKYGPATTFLITLVATLSTLAGIGTFTAILPVAFAGEIYGCGQYQVAGTLRNRGNGIHALEIYPGSKNHFDLVIHGLPLSDTIAYKDRRIHLKAFIYRAGGAGVARARFMGPIQSATPQLITSEPMQLLKSEACSAPSKSDK